MKINIDIPDWTDERAIYVMAGIELVAYKLTGGKWNIKTGRCNMCGNCCQGLERHSWPTINGTCVHLKKEPGKDNPKYECSLRINRPFGCCVGVFAEVPGCTERFEEL